MTSLPTDAVLEFATDLVTCCGRWAAEQQELVLEQKKEARNLSGAVFTEVDVEVERRVDEALAQRFPDDALVGEEYAERPGSSGRTWHVDPVDGTLNYARRLGPWSVVLSAWTGGRCDLVAVWTQAVVYSAAAGAGAWREGERLALPVETVERGGLVRVPAQLAPAAHDDGWLPRSIDSSAAEICQIADGRATGTVRLRGHPRDLHGPALLVQEAGGVVTDLSGGSWSASSSGLVAATPGAHPALLGLVP